MSSDSSLIGKSISLGIKDNTRIPLGRGSCKEGMVTGPVLPRYFLLGRALAFQGQTERASRLSRRISSLTPPPSSRSVSETIENACEVALSSVLALDDDDDDDMDGEMTRRYHRDLLKDDMGLFLDRLSRMRNEMDCDSDSQSSEEDDEDFSHFCY